MNQQPIHVLLIEDSRSQAAVMAHIITEAGYKASVYNYLPTGIVEILLKEQPDLVLLDLMLLDEEGRSAADGFKICRDIKRVDADIPVIVVTSEGDDETCEWAMLQGADAFLQKPFAQEDLTQVISETLKVHPDTDG